MFTMFSLYRRPMSGDERALQMVEQVECQETCQSVVVQQAMAGKQVEKTYSVDKVRRFQSAWLLLDSGLRLQLRRLANDALLVLGQRAAVVDADEAGSTLHNGCVALMSVQTALCNRQQYRRAHLHALGTHQSTRFMPMLCELCWCPLPMSLILATTV